jgi:hypothetical protein
MDVVAKAQDGVPYRALLYGPRFTLDQWIDGHREAIQSAKGKIILSQRCIKFANGSEILLRSDDSMFDGLDVDDVLLFAPMKRINPRGLVFSRRGCVHDLAQSREEVA